MKEYKIKTTETRIYTCYYLIEAENKIDAQEAFNMGSGELINENYRGTTDLDILSIALYEN